MTLTPGTEAKWYDYGKKKRVYLHLLLITKATARADWHCGEARDDKMTILHLHVPSRLHLFLGGKDMP